MKKSRKNSIVILLALAMLFSFASCENNKEKSGSLWENAIYTDNAELGEGEKTLTLAVKAEEKEIIFKIHSDKETVGEALQENNLVEGYEGPFGLYISHVNGIKAVYEEDGAYWGFYKNGEILPTGVDMTNFKDGESYELVYTKE